MADEELCEADLPCVICKSPLFTRANDIIICKERTCRIVVHQDCYGVPRVPQHAWYCKRCEPHSLFRASRVRCMLCAQRDGALKPTVNAKGAANTQEWAHVICALHVPGICFDDARARGLIDVAGVPKLQWGQANCSICLQEGRGTDANVGLSVACGHDGCSKRVHVSCADKRGLLAAGGDGEADATFGCSAHPPREMRELQQRKDQQALLKRKAAISSRLPAARGAVVAPPSAPATPPLASAAMPPQQDPSTPGLLHWCVVCHKRYRTRNGVKYHLQTHHANVGGWQNQATEIPQSVLDRSARSPSAEDEGTSRAAGQGRKRRRTSPPGPTDDGLSPTSPPAVEGERVPTGLLGETVPGFAECEAYLHVQTAQLWSLLGNRRERDDAPAGTTARAVAASAPALLLRTAALQAQTRAVQTAAAALRARRDELVAANAGLMAAEEAGSGGQGLSADEVAGLRASAGMVLSCLLPPTVGPVHAAEVLPLMAALRRVLAAQPAKTTAGAGKSEGDNPGTQIAAALVAALKTSGGM